MIGPDLGLDDPLVLLLAIQYIFYHPVETLRAADGGVRDGKFTGPLLLLNISGGDFSVTYERLSFRSGGLPVWAVEQNVFCGIFEVLAIETLCVRGAAHVVDVTGAAY